MHQGSHNERPSRRPRRLGGYELLRRLGVGGMAEVFEAERIGPHGFRKRVALKRILPHVASDPTYVRMFVNEASLAGQLDHPNIVHVFDFGEDDGDLYLAMELVEGTSVSRLLRAIAAERQTVPLDVALHIGVQASRALAHALAHRGPDGELLRLVHRDVSPGNLLISKDGHVKLADFGIACTEHQERHTDSQSLRGKIGYMSPEQVHGDVLTDRSDVFSLATVLAELLMGETLFSRGSDLDVLLRIRDADINALLQCTRHIPTDVRGVLLDALAPDPMSRPDARSLGDTLESLLARRGLAASGPDRVALLLQRFELTPQDDRAGLEAGAKPTELLPPEAFATAQAGASFDAVSRVTFMANVGGKKIGPVPLPELVRLAATGDIDAHTPVQRGNESPLPASQLTELSRIFATPALQWSTEELTGARARGQLNGASLLPVIHGLHARRETGMLFLGDGTKRKKVYFVDGRPDFVASTVRKEMLGQYLLDYGHCLSMEVDMGLAMMPQHGGRLGDALVNLGVLRPVQLYRAVTAQVRSRYLEAFRWRNGQWAFVRGAESREETYPIEQDANVLLRDATLELHPSELEAALAPLWERVLRPDPFLRKTLDAYQLPDAWRWVIEQVNGEQTVGALFARCARQSGLDEEDAMRAIFLGVSCQLFEAA
jgi:hypothetical protein